MADENFEPPEMGNLHDTENLDDMNNVQDNDNVNGKDNVHDTDHVHDADQVHDVNRMSIIQKQCMVLIMSMTDADHVHDTDDVQKMDNIHDPGTIPVVNSALEETHSSEEVKVTLTDTGAGKEKKWLGWPGENVFRMLVPIQKVGGIIGRKGEYIKKTCEETKACIKVLDGPPGTTERAHCKEKGPPADSPVAAAVAVADLRQTPQLRRTHQPAPAPAPAHPPASRLRRTHQPAPTSRSGAPTSRPQPPIYVGPHRRRVSHPPAGSGEIQQSPPSVSSFGETPTRRSSSRLPVPSNRSSVSNR